MTDNTQHTAPTAMTAARSLESVPQDKGHLYIQTNEIRNAIIHYRRSADGTLEEIERVPTGGAGSGVFKPISGEASAPNAFEGAGSVILSPDHSLLFTTNGGDNSVTSFRVGDGGELFLADITRTGNIVEGRSGTAKSLAFAPASRTLFVLHSFGPDHVRVMSVDADGALMLHPEGYTVNTAMKPNRVATMATLTPDGGFLIVGTTFDQPPTANPDGSPILWVEGIDGEPRSIASNAPDPDGLVVFALRDDATLGHPSFQDSGSASPFYSAFLHHRPRHFVVGAAVGDGVSLAHIDEQGVITTGPTVPIDTSAGKPSELCWLAVSPDDRFVFATNFGYSTLTSFRIDGNAVTIAQDPASAPVPGDGTFRALNGTVSSGPSDNWLSPDGSHLYQIYGNASALIGYSVDGDGSLHEVTRCAIPYNSPQGLVGF